MNPFNNKHTCCRRALAVLAAVLMDGPELVVIVVDLSLLARLLVVLAALIILRVDVAICRVLRAGCARQSVAANLNFSHPTGI